MWHDSLSKASTENPPFNVGDCPEFKRYFANSSLKLIEALLGVSVHLIFLVGATSGDRSDAGLTCRSGERSNLIRIFFGIAVAPSLLEFYSKRLYPKLGLLARSAVESGCGILSRPYPTL